MTWTTLVAKFLDSLTKLFFACIKQKIYNLRNLYKLIVEKTCGTHENGVISLLIWYISTIKFEDARKKFLSSSSSLCDAFIWLKDDYRCASPPSFRIVKRYLYSYLVVYRNLPRCSSCRKMRGKLERTSYLLGNCWASFAASFTCYPIRTSNGNSLGPSQPRCLLGLSLPRYTCTNQFRAICKVTQYSRYVYRLITPRSLLKSDRLIYIYFLKMQLFYTSQ